MCNLWKDLSQPCCLYMNPQIIIDFPNLPGKEFFGRLGYTWCPEQTITASNTVDSCFPSFSTTTSHWPVTKKLGHFFIVQTRVLKKIRKKFLLLTILYLFAYLFVYLLSSVFGEDIIVMRSPGHWEMYRKILKLELQWIFRSQKENDLLGYITLLTSS